MSNRLKTSLLNSSTLLLIVLTAAGYVGNYFSYSFGFGVDFLFGSIAVWIVVSLYGIRWGALASLIASSHTIALWQHPYALIIFLCETLFVAWSIRRRKQNLLTSDMIFWVFIGIPLVLFFYGYILQVGAITTSTIALKQPINGIFNTLIASLFLNCKPIYRWASFPSKKGTVFFEQILLNLLVAFVLIPTLLLTVVNNKAALKHEENALIAILDTSAHNLAADLQRWHQSGLEALRFLAQTSSQSQIVVSGQTQHSLDLAIDSLPLFKKTYIINAQRDVLAEASIPQESAREIDFSDLKIPRIPQIFVLPSINNSNNNKHKILQTLPIVLDERWLGNIIAELNIDFIDQLLKTETYSVPLKSTLLDENELLIASTDQKLSRQQKFARGEGKAIDMGLVDSERKIYHWLPSLEGKPLITRWRESSYTEELLINEEIPLILHMEAPAAPFIDYLQLLYIKNLAILLLIALTSILVAKGISRLLVQPILKLAIFTTNLPYKILNNETIELPRNSVIEMNALVNNFEVMSNTIEENITQIKLTNQKLKLAKEKSEVANKAKDQFLANISQELKTPLNSIIGYSRLVQKELTLHNSHLKSDRKDLKSSRWLRNVQQDGKYLLTLIDEILDLANSQANKITLYPSLVDVSSFMEDIVLYGRRKAAEKKLSFRFETSGELPTNIYVDEQRLRQVLLNLLNNALKFTTEGQIILHVSEFEHLDIRDKSNPIASQRSLESQVYLRFKVADTGIGIAERNLTLIFQPFEQVDKYEVAEVGTGLGLPISKELVQLMGGKLQVKSKLGTGSLFWFDLAFPDIKVTSKIEPRSTGEVIGYKGDRMTLLIVDDVKTSRLLLLEILEPLGFDILMAKNGQEGLQLAFSHQPDLILTDLFMPIKTGFTLIAELRQNYKFAKTPVVAVSASSFEEVEKQSRACGCNSFLSKPIDERKLLNLLGKHLNLEWIYQMSNK